MINSGASTGFTLPRMFCTVLSAISATLSISAAAASAVPLAENNEAQTTLSELIDSALIDSAAVPSTATLLNKSQTLNKSQESLLTTQIESSNILESLSEEPQTAAVPDFSEADTAAVSDVSSLLDTTEFSPAPPSSDLLAQVTSVSELSDVQPGDWAFTALQRLVEEYGCIEGYPDSTFRGNQALSRYEFAAGLNACLDTVLQLISPGSDLESIERLQVEFADELAAVRAQLDSLETDVAQLQDNQFSTTTKLSGNVYSYFSLATASGDVQAEGVNVFAAGNRGVTDLAPVSRTITEDPELTFSYLAWLNLTTSFTGKDRLVLQIAAGDGNGPANFYASAGLFNTFGVPFTLQTAGQEDTPVLREIFYSFPVGEKLSFTVGPRVNWYRHFDNNRFTFFGTGANSFNSSGGTQVNAVDRGAGVVVEYDVAKWLDLRLGYLADNTEFLPLPRSASDPARGLFGGTNTLTGQVGLYPTDNLNLRFLYTRSNLEPNSAGFVGGALSEPLYGFADDGFGGPLRTATADTFLFNFDWLVAKGFGLFGRYSYGSTNLFPATAGRADGDVNAQAIQIGTAFPDLIKQGALATISYVQPFEVLDGRNFLLSGGGDGGTQKEVEVSYRYPINSNFSVVPSIYWIMEANNFSDNPDIFVFNLQTQISF